MMWLGVFLFYAAVAITVTVLLPSEAIEPCARVLVFGIGMMAAGIFPAMTLLVSSMTGEGRSPSIVEQLHREICATLKSLRKTFFLLFIVVFFTLLAIALTYIDNILWNIPLQKLAVFPVIFTMILFIERAQLSFTAFLKVLQRKKEQALWLARREARAFMERAQKDAKLPSDDYGSRTGTLRKAGTSD